MSGDCVRSLPVKVFCIVTFVCVMLFSAGSAVGREAAGGSVTSVESKPAKLAFTSKKNGEYIFDTGILRGKLPQGDKTLGLSSVVHVPSGTELNGGYGIFSYYRVFTTNKRYGTAAWDWPSTSKLLSDGAVQITWPEGKERPFEMVAIYRWGANSTLDIETIVKARKDLSNFEVFLASYFNETFPTSYVCVGNHPDAKKRPGFLMAKKSYGDWQMFPRSQKVLGVIHDGRWQKEPHPVKWVIMPQMKRPIGLRCGAKGDLTAVLMAPVEDCFAIATPCEGESHYSMYLSLFGRDIKAGETAGARTRFVVTTAGSEKEILDLYRKYMKDIAKEAKERR